MEVVGRCGDLWRLKAEEMKAVVLNGCGWRDESSEKRQEEEEKQGELGVVELGKKISCTKAEVRGGDVGAKAGGRSAVDGGEKGVWRLNCGVCCVVEGDDCGDAGWKGGRWCTAGESQGGGRGWLREWRSVVVVGEMNDGTV